MYKNVCILNKDVLVQKQGELHSMQVRVFSSGK